MLLAFRLMILLLFAGLCHANALHNIPIARLQLPPGFQVEVLAKVPEARQMTWGDRGTLFVGSKSGRVYALTGYGHKPEVLEVAQDLELPVGVAFKNGDLYISAVSRIVKLAGIESRLGNPPRPEVVVDDLPQERQHGWKFIAFGPDGALYVPVGAPCNICRPERERYALIQRLLPGRKNSRQVVAYGVRNTVGFDWQPGTGELWFSDNGRDLLGDDLPPDELNRLSRVGQDFGYPFCHGRSVLDPEFGAGKRCADFTPPVQELGAHVAPLGLRFYTGQQFPAFYRQQIFIAEHGSWNRSRKQGYQVSLVRLKDGRAVAYEPFVSGWLDRKTDRAWGRPADVSVAPDGALLVSDDYLGVIYRISYVGAP